MNGSYFLFLHVPYKFLLKTGHFEYYNVVTLKIRSLPSSGLFFLLAVGCSCLFSDFFEPVFSGCYSFVCGFCCPCFFSLWSARGVTEIFLYVWSQKINKIVKRKKRRKENTLPDFAEIDSVLGRCFKAYSIGPLQHCLNLDFLLTLNLKICWRWKLRVFSGLSWSWVPGLVLGFLESPLYAGALRSTWPYCDLLPLEAAACLSSSIFFFFFWPHWAACGILFPWPRIEPMPPALGVWS